MVTQFTRGQVVDVLAISRDLELFSGMEVVDQVKMDLREEWAFQRRRRGDDLDEGHQPTSTELLELVPPENPLAQQLLITLESLHRVLSL